MAYKPTLIINGESFTSAFGTYTCERVPVYSDSVTTMDGVEHKVLIRTKSVLEFKVNPLSEDDTVRLFTALNMQPAEVSFFDLQTGEQRTANMVCNIPQAAMIRGLIHNGQRWNEFDSITLEEL